MVLVFEAGKSGLRVAFLSHLHSIAFNIFLKQIKIYFFLNEKGIWK